MEILGSDNSDSESTVIWDMTPCSLVDHYQGFGQIAFSIFRVEEQGAWDKVVCDLGKEGQGLG
jgi:hypothetical protein